MLVALIAKDKDGAQQTRLDNRPAHVDYLLKDRAAWEEHFKWRLEWSPDRIPTAVVDSNRTVPADHEVVTGLYCGSLYGHIRTWLTFEGSCYLLADDEGLFTEIIDSICKYRGH